MGLMWQMAGAHCCYQTAASLAQAPGWLMAAAATKKTPQEAQGLQAVATAEYPHSAPGHLERHCILQAMIRRCCGHAARLCVNDLHKHSCNGWVAMLSAEGMQRNGSIMCWPFTYRFHSREL
jgi:hypothetical protein